MLEAEFFGYEKGAFSGALRSHRGYLERADKGTLFLDEVGDLPASMQAKLLRALQERCFFRLGTERTVKSDFRIIAATNRDLYADMSAGVVSGGPLLSVGCNPDLATPIAGAARRHTLVDRATPGCDGTGARPPLGDVRNLSA